jgi:4-hydroxyacetophenone monooxygenase
MHVTGRKGLSLQDKWGDDDAKAYLGIAVPDFPGLFLLYGPNTNLGHGGSVVFHIECQVRFVMGVITEMLNRQALSVEVHQEAYDKYVTAVDAAHEKMIWTYPGLDTWYRNKNGRVVNNSPWRLVDYWRMTRTPDPTDFEWLGTS